MVDTHKDTPPAEKTTDEKPKEDVKKAVDAAKNKAEEDAAKRKAQDEASKKKADDEPAKKKGEAERQEDLANHLIRSFYMLTQLAFNSKKISRSWERLGA